MEEWRSEKYTKEENMGSAAWSQKNKSDSG
jgi:hypothetical protein